MTTPKRGTGLVNRRQHQVEDEAIERTSEGRRSCTSQEAKSMLRAAERQVQSTKENSRYNMCLIYLRLLLDRAA